MGFEFPEQQKSITTVFDTFFQLALSKRLSLAIHMYRFQQAGFAGSILSIK
jgi:hypothetical protein